MEGGVEVTMAMLVEVLMPEAVEGEEDATHGQILVLFVKYVADQVM